VTSPAWDGKGQDPWLPHRLNARLEIAATERDIRNAFWAELSGWLVETTRAVLSGGGRPNPDAVWARMPAWREAVDLLLQGEILKAIGLAFQRLLGGDFPWDQRVFVVRYLAEVRNRLVRVPDEVFDLIAHEVAVGVNLGEGIPQLRARIDVVLSTSDSERWPNRATVIARTETIGALNAGRSDAFTAVAEENPDEELERVWLATDDSRTRHTHEVADGQRVPLGAPFNVGGHELRFPGDPLGPPQEVIQCRCTMLLMERGETIDLSNRQFRPSR
jgi:Phage Mu protein F like protein